MRLCDSGPGVFCVSRSNSPPALLQVLTPLSSLLLGAVDVVFELDADLSLIRQVSDEGMLKQLLRAGPLRVVLHQAAVNKRLELLRPVETQEKKSGKSFRLPSSPNLLKCFMSALIKFTSSSHEQINQGRLTKRRNVTSLIYILRT